MASVYGTWPVSKIKEELRRRNARISGRKSDLVERLEAYDRNDNFGEDEELQAEYKMYVPHISQYKDLHADMDVPVLTTNSLQKYLSIMEKKLDKNPIQLYENNFVNYIRVCTDEAQFTFFKAEIRAQMKKHIVYAVDVCLSTHGTVEKCQCECAAGMGPHAHCKHVSCVLFGLTEFSKNREFKTLTTCTQQLQAFHHRKRHVGSPIKAEKLSLHVSDDTDFEPRPVKFQEQDGYFDHFRNVVINSQLFGQAPIMQNFLPANPYTINLDHEYFNFTQAEQFLRCIGIKDVSNEYIKNLECLTRNNQTLWKEERCKRLCSSSFGLVCKVTNRANKSALVRNIIDSKGFRSKATAHGRTYEHVAVQKYDQLRGETSRECGLCVRQSHPFLASTPDRIVSDELLLEVKCPYTAKDAEISPQTVPYLFLCKETGNLQLKKNHDYYYQVQGQMFCTGANKVDFVIYTFKDFKIITIERNSSFIEGMVEKLETFYETYFKQAVLDKFFYRSYREIFDT